MGDLRFMYLPFSRLNLFEYKGSKIMIKYLPSLGPSKISPHKRSNQTGKGIKKLGLNQLNYQSLGWALTSCPGIKHSLPV
jgi:hypothetical protein